MVEVPAKSTFVDRVAASALTVRPVKVLLVLLALPFYVLGWLLGLLVVVFMFAAGAAKMGIADARVKATPPPAPVAGAD